MSVVSSRVTSTSREGKQQFTFTDLVFCQNTMSLSKFPAFCPIAPRVLLPSIKALNSPFLFSLKQATYICTLDCDIQLERHYG